MASSTFQERPILDIRHATVYRGDTRVFEDGTVSISAAPFLTAADFSVFDHIKYLALSNQAFQVPTKGSITFSATIDATTVGTEPEGRTIYGVYGPPGCADVPACADTAILAAFSIMLILPMLAIILYQIYFLSCSLQLYPN